ncbi:hypothetical protein F8280_06955 [Micromonospora noduli]|uniref:Uncharacterized protein n=1 Tax=Micromonospora noduli TaxID=709876 RepID=A0A328N2N3_9ACTN|nr:hypothetical protein [Micromonospora noduli]KAB1927525.1 hypothetical protein F8280_06955 [Micromonospora noduli]RAN96986.1 hypothetical protein LAH08_04686 [Micromonospora noduli]RAO55570.1 hypothetical protein ONO86_00934 [Micromonospora noduli]
MSIVARLVVGTIVAPFAAVGVYLHGLWAGHFLDLRATSVYCPAKPLASTSTSADWLPLRHLCRYADGTTTELVPPYVNPIVFLCLAIAVACTALALRSARRPANADLTAFEPPR